LTQSLSDGRRAISIVQHLTQGGINLIDLIDEQNAATSIAVEGLLSDANRMCPNVRDPICTDLSNPSTCNFEGVFDTDVLQITLEHFAGAERNVYYQEIVKARDDLEELLVVVEDLDDKAATFNWALYCAMVFSLLLAALCLLIMVGIACRVSRVLSCLRHCVLVPIFSVLVVLSSVFSIVFIIGSMALADLCVDSPDDRVLVILNRFREDLSPMMVEFATFYISSKSLIHIKLLFLRNSLDSPLFQAALQANCPKR
jgi:hypothetical protein